MKIQLAAYAVREHISTEFIQTYPLGQEKGWSYSYIIHGKLWQLIQCQHSQLQLRGVPIVPHIPSAQAQHFQWQ